MLEQVSSESRNGAGSSRAPGAGGRREGSCLPGPGDGGTPSKAVAWAGARARVPLCRAATTLPATAPQPGHAARRQQDIHRPTTQNKAERTKRETHAERQATCGSGGKPGTAFQAPQRAAPRGCQPPARGHQHVPLPTTHAPPLTQTKLKSRQSCEERSMKITPPRSILNIP